MLNAGMRWGERRKVKGIRHRENPKPISVLILWLMPSALHLHPFPSYLFPAFSVKHSAFSIIIVFPYIFVLAPLQLQVALLFASMKSRALVNTLFNLT